MKPEVELVSVIGSGWSLAGVDLARIPGFKIGVNDSAWRTRCNLGVTMDRLFFEGRRRELVEAFPAGDHRYLFFRAGIDKAGVALPHWLPFDCDNETAEMAVGSPPRTRLNGLNSGICAINLAFKISPARVILWGFDMCRSRDGAAYYHPPYPWAKKGGATSGGKYEEWRRHFPRILAQFEAEGIELVNASLGSAITCLPKINPETVLR